MKTHGSTSFALNCVENSCILIACDNTYTMESKDKMYLLTFSFIQYPLPFATNLSHATCLRQLKGF
jgi:hypothetical protein